MTIKDFNENFLNPLMENLTDKKHNFLIGDFNIDLMKTDTHEDSLTYLDIMTSNLFVPHIIHPTRITPHTKTLIDNIFSNLPNFSQGKSGNITLAISDHLAQFLTIPLETGENLPKKDYFKRDTKNFDRENFFLDLLSIDWDEILQLELQDPNISFSEYYTTINTLIDRYMPLRKMTKKRGKTNVQTMDYQRYIEIYEGEGHTLLQIHSHKRQDKKARIGKKLQRSKKQNNREY